LNLLVAAPDARRALLERELGADFAITWAATSEDALRLVQELAVEAVVIHLDLGEETALDAICRAKKLPPDRVPGVVVIAADVGRRALIELVRTGAYDVVVESAMKPRELPHAVRNASFDAKSAAWLEKRRAERAGEVVVVGAGDAAESLALLLEASGLTVRQCARLPQAAELKAAPKAVIVDLGAVGDAESLVRLLTAR
jgi:DNA-binding NarL/FixJ family response regulator